MEGGPPGQVICKITEQEQASFIVLGSRGEGTVRRTILGSVSDYVIHHTRVPVVTVPAFVPNPPGKESSWRYLAEKHWKIKSFHQWKTFSVFIAPPKHEGSWEHSRQLCKPETQSRVCITVGNSSNSPSPVGFIKYFSKIIRQTRKMLFTSWST